MAAEEGRVALVGVADVGGVQLIAQCILKRQLAVEGLTGEGGAASQGIGIGLDGVQQLLMVW